MATRTAPIPTPRKGFALLLAATASNAAIAAGPVTWVAPEPWFTYASVIVVLIGSLLTLRLIRAALFAPYAVNKFSKIFESLSPRKS